MRGNEFFPVFVQFSQFVLDREEGTDLQTVTALKFRRHMALKDGMT